MIALPFDRVVVVDPDRGEQELSIEEFLETPLDHRVRYILGRQLRFLDGSQPVEQTTALRALRNFEAG